MYVKKNVTLKIVFYSLSNLIQMKVDYVIQSKVQRQDFEQIVYKWLSEDDYTPKDIMENIITQYNTSGKADGHQECCIYFPAV
jgi:aspartate/glutamate racemase